MEGGNVLFEEALELGLVEITETLPGDVDDVPVLVVALFSEGVDLGVVVVVGDGNLPLEDANVGEGGVVDRDSRVVGKTLVSREVVEVVGTYQTG